MPFKSPDARRAYDRDRRRAERAGERTGVIPIAPAQRIRMASDIEAILAEAVAQVHADTSARGVDKARALSGIATVGLRLIETHDLADRMEAMERIVTLHRGA